MVGPAFPHTASHHRRQNSITEEDIFSTLEGLDLGSDHSHGPEQQHSPVAAVNSGNALPHGSSGSNQRLDSQGSNPKLHHNQSSGSNLNLSSNSNSGLNLSAMGLGSGFPLPQLEPARTLFVRNVALGVNDEELHLLMSVSTVPGWLLVLQVIQIRVNVQNWVLLEILWSSHIISDTITRRKVRALLSLPAWLID